MPCFVMLCPWLCHMLCHAMSCSRSADLWVVPSRGRDAPCRARRRRACRAAACCEQGTRSVAPRAARAWARPRSRNEPVAAALAVAAAGSSGVRLFAPLLFKLFSRVPRLVRPSGCAGAALGAAEQGAAAGEEEAAARVAGCRVVGRRLEAEDRVGVLRRAPRRRPCVAGRAAARAAEGGRQLRCLLDLVHLRSRADVAPPGEHHSTAHQSIA